MESQLKHDPKQLDDDQYPITTMSVVTTHEQRVALFRKWKQNDQSLTWNEFCEGVKPTFGCDDAVTVKWSGMWLCIEKDGYCHT